MKRNFDKQLAAYSAMAGALVAINPTSADAEIVYTDLDPDSAIVTFNDPATIDMNADGTVDFVFNIRTASGSTTGGGTYYINFGWAYGGQIAGSATNFGGANTFYFPNAYAAGASINSSLSWQDLTSAPGSLNYLTSLGGTPAYSGGNFANQTDGYLAVRFFVGTDLHYGWVRLDVGVAGPSNFITVKDFAYEAVSDAGITAGDTTGGVQPSGIATIPELTGVEAYSFGNIINFQIQPEVGDVTAELYNASGQQIAINQFNGLGGKMEVDVTAGVYFLRMRSGDAILNKQVYLSGK